MTGHAHDTQTTTIDAESGVVALINVYEVQPERQADLARLLSEATEEGMRQRPGFVSVNVHCSFDGTRVVNYAQWASKEDFERMLKDPDAQAQMKRFAAIAESVMPALYRVTAVHGRA
jgi:quinol monooxygenase YgiN